MNKNKKSEDLYAKSGRSLEGHFTNKANEEENFRVCKILGVEVRVWGAQGLKALEREVIAALRSVIRKVRPGLAVALMADYHPAEVGVVGSVIASEEHLVPDIIGGDCGCGVYAKYIGINVSHLGVEILREIYKKIMQKVPTGSAQNNELQSDLCELSLWQSLQGIPFVTAHELRKLRYQFGSLGGGNHFIELAADSEGKIWLLIHSGSRFLGGLLRQYYQAKVVALDSEESAEFIAYQETVLEFARQSRREMARRVINCIDEMSGIEIDRKGREIDLVHNYIELKQQSGSILAIHRKGACSAEEGQLGIIPGSMGSGSCIIEGRGNPASYFSSSHGSGRALSRGRAFRELSQKEFIKDMEGVVWSGSERLKDEAPRAYKDLDKVMRAQHDLVRVHHRLNPILSVKGER